MASSPEQISAAAHAELPWANPLQADAWARLLDALAARLRPGARGLDIGCGPGRLARELAARVRVELLGIDRNPDFIERARRDALPGLRFELGDAAEATGRFDFLLCIGASQAFGTPREALARCHALLEPGGLLLWADLEWAAEPSEAFLDVLGAERAMFWPSNEPPLQGWQPLAHEAASPEAWRNYESAVLAGRLRHAEATGNADLRLRAQAWKAAFEDEGQHVFAFVARLLIKEGP
jgi:cyclopropane fatty-acyl-phospholipid synthase-like methyltransferase